MIPKGPLAGAVVAVIAGYCAPVAAAAPVSADTSAIVTFPPGAHVAPQRHSDAFVFAYVLEGAVSSQLEGRPAHVYRRGENWSAQPDGHDVAIDNISATDPAKLLVVFVAAPGEHSQDA